MINKFCPMCGANNPMRWYVVKEPYRWVLQCKDCGIVYEEPKEVKN